MGGISPSTRMVKILNPPAAAYPRILAAIPLHQPRKLNPFMFAHLHNRPIPRTTIIALSPLMAQATHSRNSQEAIIDQPNRLEGPGRTIDRQGTTDRVMALIPRSSHTRVDRSVNTPT
ncbi:hypothetical protein I317_03972 [Kwoniella heveanensis CBS 569]|nr:hypothetical protein I317_03972 [Kwoniella heveanensis CBS 569]